MAIFRHRESRRNQKYHDYGIIRGVTTNPSTIKEGLGTNLQELKKFIEIADLINPLPLSLELLQMKLQKCLNKQNYLQDGLIILT